MVEKQTSADTLAAKIPTLPGSVESTTNIPDVKGDVVRVPHEDRVRAKLAWCLVALLALVVVGGFIYLAFAREWRIDSDDLKSMLELFFTSVLTLVSTVIGFYFGAEHTNRKGQER